jgi:hypothetical protein
MVELSSQFGSPYFPKGGQGKLFHDPKPIDEHRYQRGYTPERMADVEDASWNTLHGSGQLQAHFKQSLARSTAPLDAMRGQVSEVQLSHGHEKGHHVLGQHETSMGLFTGLGGSKLSIYHGAGGITHSTDKNASKSEVMGATAIHELGHAHHAHSDVDDFLKSPGHREEVADAFATEHYRPDPREVRRGTEAHAEDHSYPAQDSKMKGYRGWAKLNREAKARRSADASSRYDSTDFVSDEGDRVTHAGGHGTSWNIQSSLFNGKQFDG